MRLFLSDIAANFFLNSTEKGEKGQLQAECMSISSSTLVAELFLDHQTYASR